MNDKRKCKYCNGILTEIQLERGGNYCSSACSNKDLGLVRGSEVLRKNINKYNKNPTYCAFCHNKLSYEKRHNKFCGHSCAAAFNNNGVRRHGSPPGKCLYCEKDRRDANKFCSAKCHKEYQYKTYIDKWLKHEVSGTKSRKSGGTTSNYVRRWLFDQRGNKCEKCGWDKKNEYTGLVPVEVHHIDGNSMNNRPENLIILCPSCHSLTNNFGSANRGRGRKAIGR